MGYGLDSGIRILEEASGFSPLHTIRTVTGAYPSSYPMDTWEVNRLVRETDHSYPSSAVVKNGGAT
jgi:hypothetical protein